MASAFQSSAFQNNAFQIDGSTPPVAARGGDDAGPRRLSKHKHRVFILPRPEPEPLPVGVEPKRRKVTRKAVEAAIAQPWAGLWTAPEAMEFLPDFVPIEFVSDGPGFEVLVQAIALHLAREAERRAIEDEEDVMILLAAMN